MMLTSPREGEIAVDRLRIGKQIVTLAPSLDRKQLFVLTRGEERLHEGDEGPALAVVSGETRPSVSRLYPLSDPLQKLALDPQGDWAVVYDSGGVLVNLNELILVHLSQPEEPPLPKTIRSTGGRPERFTFTEALTLQDGAKHRLLVVETQKDIAILDLENLDAHEITVPLPKTASGAAARPAEVVYHDDLAGDAGVSSYLAIRFSNDSSVLTLRLAEATANSAHAFSLTTNLVDAGAVPSTIAFVETEAGGKPSLRLAALVPSVKAAVLFDPATSKSERVEFDKAYSGLARVTSLVADAPSTGDVALLYSSIEPSIAFWRLGFASDTPYASFESYAVDTQVTSVLDVPGAAFGHLKLLVGTQSTQFFLLDLQSRLSYPMQALNGFNLRLAPDGRRAWAFPTSGTKFARLTFEDKHPISLAVERPIADVFDIERGDGERSVLVLHSHLGDHGDLGVTLFDALEPDSAKTRFVSGLMLEGI
jgi:hypothetical protein